MLEPRGSLIKDFQNFWVNTVTPREYDTIIRFLGVDPNQASEPGAFVRPWQRIRRADVGVVLNTKFLFMNLRRFTAVCSGILVGVETSPYFDVPMASISASAIASTVVLGTNFLLDQYMKSRINNH